MRRFILFHDKRHPVEMGAAEVEAFLTHLAVEGKVAAATQNQSLVSPVVFLSRGAGDQSAVAGSGGQGQAPGAVAGGADAAGGDGGAESDEWRVWSAGTLALWCGHALDGGDPLAGERCGFCTG